MANDQGNAAVNAYLADPQTGVFKIVPGCTANLSGAIERHTLVRKALADPASSEAFWRTILRNALLLAVAMPGKTGVSNDCEALPSSSSSAKPGRPSSKVSG